MTEMPLTDYEARQLVFCDPDFARDRLNMEALVGNRRVAVAMVRERRDPYQWIALRGLSASQPPPIRA